MLNILFSLQFVWISLLVIVLSTATGLLCSVLHKQLLYITAGEWLIQHIYCPVAKVLLLMLMAFLLFPLIIEFTSYSNLAALFLHKDFLINMVNILFISSLLLSFIPVFSHPGIAMPLLGFIATALIFMHVIVIPGAIDISWIPSFSASSKIFILIVIGYMSCRWSTNQLSQWVDVRFNVSDSKGLVSDSIYLIFQMPVLLAYGQALQVQTAS